MFLLKVFFIAIVIYYALKSIGRIFLPFLFNEASQKINNQNNYKQKRAGEVTIHYKENKKNKGNRQVGEYIDYEEIKD
jgi:hypothetical protein